MIFGQYDGISCKQDVLENGRIVLQCECKNLLNGDYIKRAYLGM